MGSLRFALLILLSPHFSLAAEKEKDVIQRLNPNMASVTIVRPKTAPRLDVVGLYLKGSNQGAAILVTNHRYRDDVFVRVEGVDGRRKLDPRPKGIKFAIPVANDSTRFSIESGGETYRYQLGTPGMELALRGSTPTSRYLWDFEWDLSIWLAPVFVLYQRTNTTNLQSAQIRTGIDTSLRLNGVVIGLGGFTDTYAVYSNPSRSRGNFAEAEAFLGYRIKTQSPRLDLVPKLYGRLALTYLEEGSFGFDPLFYPRAALELRIDLGLRRRLSIEGWFGVVNVASFSINQFEAGGRVSYRGRKGLIVALEGTRRQFNPTTSVEISDLQTALRIGYAF
jgi:hypothetical protein